MKSVIVGLGFVGSFFPLACGSGDQSGAAKSPSVTAQTLSAVGECEFAACGSMPSSLASTPSVKCSGASAEDCAWSAKPPSETTSYRACTASECPTAPAIDCPAGTVHSSQQCGSEDDAACAWVTVCTPPRDTTPCPDVEGCGAQPELGVICNDGESGSLVCVTNGQKCSWQRSCD